MNVRIFDFGSVIAPLYFCHFQSVSYDQPLFMGGKKYISRGQVNFACSINASSMGLWFVSIDVMEEACVSIGIIFGMNLVSRNHYDYFNTLHQGCQPGEFRSSWLLILHLCSYERSQPKISLVNGLTCHISNQTFCLLRSQSFNDDIYI